MWPSRGPIHNYKQNCPPLQHGNHVLSVVEFQQIAEPRVNSMHCLTILEDADQLNTATVWTNLPQASCKWGNKARCNYPISMHSNSYSLIIIYGTVFKQYMTLVVCIVTSKQGFQHKSPGGRFVEFVWWTRELDDLGASLHDDDDDYSFIF